MAVLSSLLYFFPSFVVYMISHRPGKKIVWTKIFALSLVMSFKYGLIRMLVTSATGWWFLCEPKSWGFFFPRRSSLVAYSWRKMEVVKHNCLFKAFYFSFVRVWDVCEHPQHGWCVFLGRKHAVLNAYILCVYWR